MREDVAYSMVCTLYATFGKSAPQRGSAVFQAVYNRIADISDASADYITENLQDADTLPGNLGKAIIEQYFNWQNKQGVTVEKPQCGECQGAGGWECWTVDPLEILQWRHFFSRCPRCCRDRDSYKLKTKRKLEESGILVMPTNYPGGIVKFRQDMQLMPAGNSEAILQRLPSKKLQDLYMRMNHPTGYARDYSQDGASKAPREQGGL